MKIHQLYTDSGLRNFTYFIIINKADCYVIDPWDSSMVNDYLEYNNLTIKAIINTHEHWDHTQGNKELINQHHCEVWGHKNGEGKIPGLSRTFTGGENVSLSDTVTLEILDTPGHSLAHLCFLLYKNNFPKALFSGDILFNAGVGNCHNGGNVEELYETITDKFSTLADDIIVYPGHDYLQNNLNFTLSREPSNSTAKLWLSKYQQYDIHAQPLTTTMADERQFNTFLRLENEEIRKNLSFPAENNKQVFVALRALRDKW